MSTSGEEPVVATGEEPECRPPSSPIHAAPPAIDHEINCYCSNPLELEIYESCSANRDASEEDCIKQVHRLLVGRFETALSCCPGLAALSCCSILLPYLAAPVLLPYLVAPVLLPYLAVLALGPALHCAGLLCAAWAVGG